MIVLRLDSITEDHVVTVAIHPADLKEFFSLPQVASWPVRGDLANDQVISYPCLMRVVVDESAIAGRAS